MAEEAWLVVGLGNPGATHAGNRHNVGHMVVDLLAQRVGGTFRPHKTVRAYVLETRLSDPPGVRVALAKPRSYMNNSGGPVAGLRDYYGIEPDRIVVIHDEIDIPYGRLRAKFGGSDNGHNGLRSIRKSLGTGDFYRVRFGVGRPPGHGDPSEHVLRDFNAAERKELDAYVDRAADAVECLILDGLGRTQQYYNS
jgi:peptidyl-tRNA hydrolase, PTH1 family